MAIHKILCNIRCMSITKPSKTTLYILIAFILFDIILLNGIFQFMFSQIDGLIIINSLLTTILSLAYNSLLLKISIPLNMITYSCMYILILTLPVTISYCLDMAGLSKRSK